MDVDRSVYGPTCPILPFIIHLLYDTCEAGLNSVTSAYPREDVSSNQHVFTSLEILGDLCLRLGVVNKLVWITDHEGLLDIELW